MRQHRRMDFRASCWCGSMLVWWVCSLGCGPGGPQRYRISGNVSFEGQPLAIGQISFEPETQGHGGGFAPVIQGKFDTNVDGRGHLGGLHQVRIIGFAPVGDPNDPNVTVDSIFRPYDQTLDLPKQTSEMDFEVPATLKINASRKAKNMRESANE